MKLTPEQLQRAAELAPKVAELAGNSITLFQYNTREPSQFLINNTLDGGCTTEVVDLLDIRAFQAVVLALPDDVVGRILYAELWDEKGRLLFKWLLTPAGMLAFYEALCLN